jgi:hypothetical protein
MAGVVVGGNFTSLGGIESQGAALFNQNTSAITPLTGLSGQVSALLCDESTNTVYVGGSFKGANSTNAIAWVGTAGWTDLPFSGFNGPVTSITKASNGHIVFGGSFTGLGNATGPSLPDQQIINICWGKYHKWLFNINSWLQRPEEHCVQDQRYRRGWQHLAAR